MSKGKKRSRKSKLEVRTDDFDDTENTILQKLPRLLDVKPTNLDHTYSIQDGSPLLLSVKVEVEEFDESIMGTESEDTNESMVMKPGPSKLIVPHINKRRQTTIQVFNANVDKMFKISDHIIWSSTNTADKYLGVEIKNIWGRLLRIEEDYDPYNELIQKALHNWVTSFVYIRNNMKVPIFYQCLICKLAWWYLYSFREHIRCHDHKKLKVYHQETFHESVIVASTEFNDSNLYIECEGDCYRCGNSFYFHVKSPEIPYSCTDCGGEFNSCMTLQQHKSICGNTILKLKQKCKLCDTQVSYKTNEMDKHIITCHLVRSDIPIPLSFKTCAACNKIYHHHYTHMCEKSFKSSGCTFCYRKFHTKMLADFHVQMGGTSYRCNLCQELLPKKCMVTEHMLFHTSNYKMMFKCVNPICPPTMLFPDENAVKQHKWIYHKQKFDRRRSNYEMVLVPEQCVKLDTVSNKHHLAACEGIAKCKAVKPQEQQDTDLGPSTGNCQAEEQMDKQIIQENIDIKQEMQDIPEPEFTDDSQDAATDYEQMLSKVFQVSESVRNNQPFASSVEPETPEIKTEPPDQIDFDELIDIEEHPIKEEIIEDGQCEIYGAYEIGGACEIDRPCEIGGACEIDRPCEIGGVCEIGVTCDIKSEPQEYETDNIHDGDMQHTVKIEPEEIKQEMVEASDMQIMESLEKTIPIIPQIVPAKPMLTAQPIKIYLKSLKNPKSLLKGNFARYILDQTTPKLKTEQVNHPKPAVKQKRADSKLNGLPQTKKKIISNLLRQRRIYTCTKCGYKNKHKLYRIHTKSNCEQSPIVDLDKKYNKYTCTKCDTSFCTLKAYVLHFESDHGYKELDCPVCLVNFSSVKDLLPHFFKHVRQNFVNCWLINKKLEAPTKKQQRCQKCHKNVPPEHHFPHWESHLQLNLVVKQELKPEPVEVTEVNVSVNTKTLIPTVLQTALQQLQSVMRESECLVCYRKFARRHDLKRHIIEHLLLDAYTKKSITQMFRCQLCSVNFVRAEQYKFHMREHGALPVYRCELCNKTFSDSSNFAKHKKIHSLKVLICDICQKKFHAKSSLEKHILMHQITEPITCHLCSKSFYAMSHYRKHVQVRHDRSTKFKCILCDEVFDSLRKKWDHAWAVHNERKLKADCPICDLGFRKYSDVKNHAKMEHGLELTFCNIKSEACQGRKTLCRIMKDDTLLIPTYDSLT